MSTNDSLLAMVNGGRQRKASLGVNGFGLGPAVAPPAVVTEAAFSLSDIASTSATSELSFAVTVFRGLSATTGKNRAPARALVANARIAAHELLELLAPANGPDLVDGKDLDAAKRWGVRYALPACLAPGLSRSAATVQTGTFIALDFDGVTPEALDSKLQLLRDAGLHFMAFSTINDGVKDTTKGRRVRVVLLLDRAANADEYKGCYEVADSLLNSGSLQADECGQPSRLIGVWSAYTQSLLRRLELAPAWAPFREVGEGSAVSVDACLRARTRIAGAQEPGSGRLLGDRPPWLERLRGIDTAVDLSGGVSSGDQPEPLSPATVARIIEALDWLDPNCSVQSWTKIGMAAHSAAAGVEEAGAVPSVGAAWVEWSERASDGRKARNDAPGTDPAGMWARWDKNPPQMPPEAGAGTLLGLARDAAVLVARGARGAKSWADAPAKALAYLQRYHAKAASEFNGQDYPPASAGAGNAADRARQRLHRMVAEAFTTIVDQHGRCWAQDKRNGELLLVGGQEFNDAVLLLAHRSGAATPGKDARETLCSLLAAEARSRRTQSTVCLRFAEDDGSVVVDLGDGTGAAVVVTGEGWRVTPEHGCLFARSRGYGALPVPVDVGGVPDAWALVVSFLRGLGLPEREAQLVVVVLLKWMLSSGAHPLIDLVGPAGSGKSTTGNTLIQILDPTTSGRAAEPQALDAETLGSMAQHVAAVLVDNSSQLSRDAQDLLCQLCTGAEWAARTLYTNTELTRSTVHLRTVINGITTSITRADLLDRAVRVRLAGNRSKKPTAQILAEFRAVHPRLLGALCTLLSAAMGQGCALGPATHRLVEFQQLGRGVFLALGQSAADFDALFSSHRRDIAVWTAEGDPFARSLLAALQVLAGQAEPAEKVPGWRLWAASPGHVAIRQGAGTVLVVATPAALLAAIKKHCPREFHQHGRDFDAAVPTHARALEGAITRAIPLLREIGWTVEKRDFGSKRSAWVCVQAGGAEDASE